MSRRRCATDQAAQAKGIERTRPDGTIIFEAEDSVWPARRCRAGSATTARYFHAIQRSSTDTTESPSLTELAMRVLVIEDYEPIRCAIARGLCEAEFEVEMASNGEDGLWMAKTNAFDVIVLDLMLPKIDGLSVLKQLREERNESHVIILTAKDTVDDRIHGLDLGADDYLTKPFVFGELLARVRAMIRRKYGEKNPTITICDLAIDTVRRAVTRGGNEIRLTSREYALLEYLALRAGEVVTRSDVWGHVYDFYDDAHSNVVDVYIGYLRRKIERPGMMKLIHTRRGHGYVLGELT